MCRNCAWHHNVQLLCTCTIYLLQTSCSWGLISWEEHVPALCSYPPCSKPQKSPSTALVELWSYVLWYLLLDLLCSPTSCSLVIACWVHNIIIMLHWWLLLNWVIFLDMCFPHLSVALFISRYHIFELLPTCMYIHTYINVHSSAIPAFLQHRI